MKKFNLLLLTVLLFLGIGASAQFSLTTVPPLNGGNGNQGIVFGVEAHRAVILDSIYVSVTNGSSGNTDVWYTTTDLTGPPDVSVAGGWTQVVTPNANNTINITTAGGGDGTLTAIPFDFGLVLTPGTEYRFFINGNIGASIRYTTGAAGAAAPFSDDFLTIETGANVGYGGPAPNPGFTPRQFNGRLIYSPLGGMDDAAVISVDEPVSFCSGSQDVFATIANFGINQIDSVDIVWEVNGVAQPTYQFIGLLDTLSGTGSFDTSINIGSATFNADSNTVFLYTTNPNGASDTTNYNDTLEFLTISSKVPENVTISDILTTSVTVSAENFPGDLDYEYDLSPFNANSIGTGNSGTSSSPSFSITGLTAGTEYQIYLRNNCGGVPADTSDWIGPFTFYTSSTVPFEQDFEDFVDARRNPLREGWTASSSNGFLTTPDWEGERATGFNQNIGGAGGPLFDHTNFGVGGGTHMIMNSWLGGIADSADLVSPPVFISAAQNKVRLSYWYFMFGAATKNLKVIIDTNGVEEVIAEYVGEQQARQNEDWLLAEHYLDGYAGKSVVVKFRSYGEFTQPNRPAIDDVRLDTIVDVNASISEILEPSGALCAGPQSPVVVVRNTGIDDLTSFDVVADVNGVLDTTSHVRTITTGDTAHITLNSVNFSTGILYDLSFHTTNPNGVADQDNSDDTLALPTLTTGLAGVVTIDANAPVSATNFLTFRALASRLNSVGVCGSVNVYVAPGDYIGDYFVLGNVDGLSATNTLTIDGDSATNSRDSVLIRNTGSASQATFGFNRTSYVTIKNMRVEGRYSGGGPEFGAHFSNISNHNRLENIFFDMDPLTFNCVTIGASSDINSQFAANSRSNANYNEFINLELEGSDDPVYFEGPLSPVDGFNTGNQFIDCKIYNFNTTAMLFDGSDSTVIDGDSIAGARNSNFNSYIQMFDAMNFRISNNIIIATDEAIRINEANSTVNPELNAEIYNNMISVTQSRFGYAIYLRNPLRINMWYNSIYSADENQPAVHFDGFTLIDSLDVRNNIFTTFNNIALRMNGADDTLAFLRFDNNIYNRDVPGTLLDMNGTTYNNLASYQSAVPQFNVNSKNEDPQFNSVTDLHIIGVVPSDAADISVPVFDDVDGDVRPSINALNPDIGADEYDPPSCPPPTGLKVEFVRADSVRVTWVPKSPGTRVQYEYDTNPFTIGNGTSAVSTTDTGLIGGLLENTEYAIAIRQVCGRGDTSRFTKQLVFRTPCFPKTAGYFNNFDTEPLNEPAACWSQFYENDGQNYAEVRTFPNVIGARSLVISTWFGLGNIDTSMAISPIMDSITNGDYRIKFTTNSENVANALIVGTTPAEGGGSGFTPLDTIVHAAATVNETHFVDITTANGYNGNDQHIAFIHSGNTDFDEIKIDEFLYEEIPSCLEPRDPALEFLGSDSVIIGWEDPAGAAEWQIEYGFSPLVLGTGTRFTSTVNPDTLTGLLPNSNYEFFVRTVCIPGDTSAWSSGLEFTTECLGDTAEVFENWDAAVINQTPDCWFEYVTGTQIGAPGLAPGVRVTTFNAFSGNQKLQLNTWQGGVTDTVAAISNRYLDMTDGDKRLRFQIASSDFQLLQDAKVFTVDKRGPGANWTEMEAITFLAPNTYTEYVVDLTTANGYNGTDQYIAFSAGTELGDQIRIDDYYYEDIPSCPRPRDLVAIPGTDTAVVFWNNTSPSDTVMVAISLAPFDSSTAVYDTIVGNRDTIRGLFGGSFYEYRVAVICGPGDTSRASSVLQFLTECIPLNAPFFTDFESDRADEPAVCWEEYSTQPNNNFFTARVENFTGFNSQQAVELNSWNFTNPAVDTIMAITPELGGMSDGDKRLRFQTFAQNPLDRMFIYTADRPGGNANFTILDTIEYTTGNAWKLEYVDITTANGYNGTDSVIAFRHSQDATFTDLRIDDFHYEEIPSCLAPRDNFANNLFPDSANLGWDDYATGVAEWEIEYDSNFTTADIGTGISIIVTSNPYGLSGLESNTDYGFRVRAICAAGDTSFWTDVVEFRTPCNAFTAPYFTDFDDDAVNGMPECWSDYETYQPNFNKVLVTNFGNVVSAPNVLELNSWFNFTLGADTILAVTPKFSDITDGDKRLRFQAATNQFNIVNTLWIWTADGPDPATANINVVDTINFQTQNDPEEFVVNLDSANGYNRTDEYIYLVHGIGGNGIVEIQIDDFHYEEIPTCLRPADADHLHFNADSTELSWTDPNGATWFEIEYGLRGFAPGSGTKVYSTSATDTLYNLVPSSYYDAYIRAICDTTAGNEDSSITVLYSFESFCANLPSPYTTSFEPVPDDSLPVCWNKVEVYTGGTPPVNLWGVKVEDAAFSSRTGTKALIFNHWNANGTNNDTLIAITPPMDSITNGDNRLIFWANNSDFGLDNVMIVGTTPTATGNGTFNVLDTIDWANNNQWDEFVVDITAANGYNGTDQYIYFEQELVGANANFSEIRVDDINYEKIPTCWPPLSMNAQFIGADSAFLAWVDDTINASTPTEWQIEFGRKGFALGTGDRVIVTSNSVLVDTLQAQTGYDYYVRPICSAGDTSIWPEVPGSFFTSCDLAITQGAVLPWLEVWDSVVTRVQIGDGFILCDSSYQWLFATSDQVNGRARTGDTSITSHSVNGKAVTLDAANTGITPDAINELILTIDLDSYKPYGDLRLEFSIMHHGEERDSNDYISIRGWQGDPWIRVAYIPDAVGLGTWTRLAFDIDTILGLQGQMVSSSFQVKFGQEDNWTATAINASDGITVDSISITGGTVIVQPVGVDDIADKLNGISIYPNPSTGLFTIDIKSEQIETYNVTVRDIKGQIVHEEIANVNGKYRKNVDFTSFAKGVYFMQVQSDNNSYVEKLVIQ